MSQQNTIEKLYLELVKIFEPLRRATRITPIPTGLLWLARRIGFSFEDILQDVNSLSAFCNNINGVYDILESVLERENNIENEIELNEIVDATQRLFQAFESLNDLQLKPDLPENLRNPSHLISRYLLILYLEDYQPGWLGFLKLIGVILPEKEDGLPDIDFNRIPSAILNFSDIPRNVFGWGTENLDISSLFDALQDILLFFNIPVSGNLPSLNSNYFGIDTDSLASLIQIDIPIISSLDKQNQSFKSGFSLLELPKKDPENLVPGLAIIPFGSVDISDSIPIGKNWEATFSFSGNSPENLGIAIRVGSVRIISLADGSSIPTISFSYRIQRTNNAEGKMPVLSQEGMFEIFASIEGFNLVAQASNDFNFTLEVFVDARIQLLQPSEKMDGFLSAVLPKNGITTNVNLTLGWSVKHGFTLNGSTGLEVSYPLNQSIGPIHIEKTQLGFIFNTEDKLTFSTTADLSVNLGPVLIGINGAGIHSGINLKGSSFIFGDLNFDFASPVGLSIAIDTDIINGGGFIELDPEKGRYSGILQLELFDIGISAIGILDTKDNNGNLLPPPGFSFLIIILADLPMVQLGFGFTLNGVGGLIGIHRTTQTEALKNKLKEGAVDSILFPEDPLQNMSRIVGDIRDVFPTQIDQFVFGPMLQIGWGTPTIFEIEMALILDLPDPVRLILLGQLHAVLPSEKFPVVIINVDLVGILDFGQKLIYIEAKVRDSRLAGFKLTGGMAFYLNWGRDADFILSIGGFHPAYANAPSLPVIDRLGISLSYGDLLYIGVEGYFAVTSNSIQFGARAELFLGIDEVNIHGWMSFDALLIFSPFYFRFDFTYGFTVNIAGKTLAGISFSGTLEGPNPFRIYGEGCISILFIDICVDFDFTIGEKKVEDPLPIKNPWEDLLAAIKEPANWEALLPSYVYLGVNVSLPKELASSILVHPMGQLKFMQQVVPLNKKLEKFGEFAITEQDHFNVISVLAGDRPISRENLNFEQALFAAGQYEYLSVQQKLERESFEFMDAGLDFSSQLQVDVGKKITKRTLVYEQNIIDNPNESRETTDTVSFDKQEQLGDLIGKYRRTPLGSEKSKYFNPNRHSDKLGLREEAYNIAPSIDENVLPAQILSKLISGSKRTEISRRLDQLSKEFPEFSKYLKIKKEH